MGFVYEEADVKDERQAKDWEYLQSLGIKNIWNYLIGPDFCDLIVDREKRIYLIPLGSTNLNRDKIEVSYYVLCIHDQIINVEVQEQCSGRGRDKSFECNWLIKKVIFPPEWTFDLVGKEELKDIIRKGFTVRTYNNSLTPEQVKEITVDFAMFPDNNGEIK